MDIFAKMGKLTKWPGLRKRSKRPKKFQKASFSKNVKIANMAKLAGMVKLAKLAKMAEIIQMA